MADMDRDHLIGHIVDHLGKALGRIQPRQTALFFKADPDYGRRVAEGLGLNIEEVKRLVGLSAEQRGAATAQLTRFSSFKKETAMADKIEVCMCEKCGNEAEMTISCQWVDVQAPSGETQKKQKETRTCKVCGNEADMIIDFGG